MKNKKLIDKLLESANESKEVCIILKEAMVSLGEYEFAASFRAIEREHMKLELEKDVNTSKENKKDERFSFKLSLEGARKLVRISYDILVSKTLAWGEALPLKLIGKWAYLIDSEEDFIVDQDLYEQIRGHCTKEQHELLDEIFGKDEQDWFPGELYWVKENDFVGLKYAHKNYGEFINLKPFTLYGFKGMAFPFKVFIKADGVKLPEL